MGIAGSLAHLCRENQKNEKMRVCRTRFYAPQKHDDITISRTDPFTGQYQLSVSDGGTDPIALGAGYMAEMAALTAYYAAPQAAIMVLAPEFFPEDIFCLEAADSGATETFYRTMSQADLEQLIDTGQIPATGETFVSPSLGYSSGFNGVTVQFNVQAGTTDSLLGMGVRNTAAGFTGTAYEGLPIVSGGWADTSAFFKWEQGVVNIGLGNGQALNIFNANIVTFGVVP